MDYQIFAEPGNQKSTHDVVLLSPDGVKVGLVLSNNEGQRFGLGINRDPVNRTAMQTHQGTADWASYKYPWTPVAKQDWTGGRGLSDADKDSSRFFDSKRADTSNGYIINAPLETYTEGLHVMAFDLPADGLKWYSMADEYSVIARKFTYSGDAENLAFHVRRIGTPLEAITIEIRNDDGDAVGSTVLATCEVDTDDITDVVSEFIHKSFTEVALSGSYWIVFTTEDGTDNDHWEIGGYDETGTRTVLFDGSSWSDATFKVYYKVSEELQDTETTLFRYKRAVYALVQAEGSAPKIYILGDRGVADAPTGGADTLLDASKSWTADEYAGATVIIIDGKGFNERKPFRKIVSNTATQLTLESDWKITHDNTTEYVIVGGNTWREITGHGLTTWVTGITQSREVLYFCQGDSTNIRRMRWYNNSGTATYDWADDGTNKAFKMALVRETGGLKIWRGNNSDASGNVSVSKADSQSWGSNLSFGTVYTFYDSEYGNIVNLSEYGDSPKYLYVYREGMVFTVDSSGTIDKIPLEEMSTSMHYSNGKHVLVHNVYNWFSMGASLERYYGNEISDKGPNLDDGLPDDRQGEISGLLGLPGYIFVSVDADDNYSSVYKYNMLGYHEFYRSPVMGHKITSIHYEVVYASADRLLIVVGNDVVWLPIVSLTNNPLKISDMRFTHETVVTSGYIYSGMYDTWKLFYGLKIVTEQMPEGTWINAEWRTDDSEDWTAIETPYTLTPVQTHPVSDYGISSKKIQIRLRLHTEDSSQAPKIIAYILDSISRITVQYAFSLNYRVTESAVNLVGRYNDKTEYDAQTILDQWASTITPLKMRSRYSEYDDMVVFVNPTPSRPYKSNDDSYIHSLSLVQIGIEAMEDA